jgi:hypothetical protein
MHRPLIRAGGAEAAETHQKGPCCGTSRPRCAEEGQVGEEGHTGEESAKGGQKNSVPFPLPPDSTPAAFLVAAPLRWLRSRAGNPFSRPCSAMKVHLVSHCRILLCSLNGMGSRFNTISISVVVNGKNRLPFPAPKSLISSSTGSAVALSCLTSLPYP